MRCPHCGRPKSDCYRHCHERGDGVHQPDPNSVAPADGVGKGRGTDWIIDILCYTCGISGSMEIDPADISWE